MPLTLHRRTKHENDSQNHHRTNDINPDLSYLGEYSNKPGDPDKTIDRKEKGTWEWGEKQYFIAANSAAETGNPESVEQDWERMEAHGISWDMIGIRAKAKIKIGGTHTIRSGGLWNIESDSGEDYLTEVAAGELAQLRNTLTELGFSEEEINEAFKVKETVNP